MGWRVGIDTGGIYTDLVAVWGQDRRIAKTPSSLPDYDEGVLDAIRAAGISPAEIDLIAHGTTVATNAIIVGGGAPSACPRVVAIIRPDRRVHPAMAGRGLSKRPARLRARTVAVSCPSERE